MLIRYYCHLVAFTVCGVFLLAATGCGDKTPPASSEPTATANSAPSTTQSTQYASPAEQSKAQFYKGQQNPGSNH